MRIDEWWVTVLASRLFGELAPGAKLWNLSPSSFRKRWDRICLALGVTSRPNDGSTPASLRAGGATSHFEIYEDIEKLRRRARWTVTFGRWPHFACASLGTSTIVTHNGS